MRCVSLLLIFLTLLIVPDAQAARIGDVVESGVWEQAVRFFSLRDTTVRLALTGSVLLGVSCGLLGAFLVVRKMALAGDVLSHAVLPGVAAGFLWNASKDPIAIFVGATIAGLSGTIVVSLITRGTKLKEDAAMALVLAVFFAIGLVLMNVIQQMPDATKSGIDKCLFGQAAALSGTDIQLMAAVTITTLLVVTVFYKELLVSSFDPVFAQTIGVRVLWVHHAFMFLLSAAVVVALQAVGVVLISAMLITPAATAYLLTHRMRGMLLISAVCGTVAGIVGAFVSFLQSNLPTGPCMVVAASTLFGMAVVFSPLHGVVPRWRRTRVRERRIHRENTLKAVYQLLETQDPPRAAVTTQELAGQRRYSIKQSAMDTAQLASEGLVVFEDDRKTLRLSAEGQRQAESIVRNHRLWELYLTEKANFRPDHVHDDAELIEHVLGEEIVKKLEFRLGHPQRDPHGKSIPRPK